MYNNDFSSSLLDNAVSEFSKLPGIGKKTALRLVLHLIGKEKDEVSKFGNTIIKLRENIKKCKVCRNISDNDVCNICSDSSRDKSIICVTENIKDVIAIENTGQFRGLYHVLGGLISPMDGIGPDNLEIESLQKRFESGEIKEVILALSANPEGETTNFYIFRKIASYNVEITMLARGVAVGGELEYADELTLGRSIINRIKFNN